MPVAFTPPALAGGDRPYPINLPTALQLAQANNLDVALASERIRVAVAQFDRAKVLWLPTLYLGGDYFRHDGQIQDVGGQIFGTSKSSLMGGVGPSMVFAVTDAIFEPLAARQVVNARHAALQAASNDTALTVAESYFGVQQARGELAGAEDALRRAEEVVRRADKLAPDLVPKLEAARARTELARRRQWLQVARERWRVSSAELARLLRLDATVLVEPIEPPFLQVSLVSPGCPVDDLIAQALTARPELAAQQALVQATLKRLREEKLRPLVPSVLLRGAATNPAGTLSSGAFGGGRNDRIADGSFRNSLDLQLIWEFQNLGLGNRARINERRAELEISTLELFRTQDRVAAEVVQAHAQVQSAAARVGEAESGLRDAVESAAQNIEGLGQTKRLAGNIVLLVIRPQEAVAAVQALSQAYGDYYGSIADYNRAQYRLFRALGNRPEPAGDQPEGCAEPAKPE
ncbi:MAG: TolC family protein [Planctomycetia bacterium]|nr:TolC family protein [Planctomycetia bacterium]